MDGQYRFNGFHLDWLVLRATLRAIVYPEGMMGLLWMTTQRVTLDQLNEAAA